MMTVLLLGETSAPCQWRPPLRSPEVTIDSGVVWFTEELDHDFFACAHANKDGELTAEFVDADRPTIVISSSEKIRQATIRHGAYRNNFCDLDPTPKRMFARLRGQGLFNPANFRSPVLDVPEDMCPRCPKLSPSLQTRFERAKGSKDWLLHVSWDKAWHNCAGPKSTLGVRFFTGRSRESVVAAIKPTYSIPSLEKRHSHDLKLSAKILCTSGAEYLAYEIVGSGAMEPLGRAGDRYVETLACP